MQNLIEFSQDLNMALSAFILETTATTTTKGPALSDWDHSPSVAGLELLTTSLSKPATTPLLRYVQNG